MMQLSTKVSGHHRGLYKEFPGDRGFPPGNASCKPNSCPEGGKSDSAFRDHYTRLPVKFKQTRLPKEQFHSPLDMALKMKTGTLEHVVTCFPYPPDTPPPDSPTELRLETVKHPSIPVKPLDEMGVFNALHALSRNFKPSSSSKDYENATANLDGGVDGKTRLAPVNASTVDSTRQGSFARSFETLGSFRHHGAHGENWNEEKMARFADAMRRALRDAKFALDQTVDDAEEPNPTSDSNQIPAFRRLASTQNKVADLLPEFSYILGIMIREEPVVQQAVTYRFVLNTHWEKLLAEISKNKDVVADKEIVKQVAALEKMWSLRFGVVPWHTIVKERKKEMKETGCLRNLKLILRSDWDIDEPINWTVENPKQGANLEGSLGFVPGHWWVNTHAAMRDGIIANATEAITKGASGVTALALTVGEEKDTTFDNTTEYIIEGHKRLMPFSLLGQKHPVRILRGMNLKSPYAPEAGVRYDGLYMLKSWGHKLIDDQAKVYQCKLTIERIAEDQKPFEEVLLQPQPSQIDQYMLHIQDVNTYILESCGQATHKRWCAKFEHGERKRKEWRRELGLVAE